MYPSSDFRRYLPYVVIVGAYVAGLFVDVMEIDATQYATMGRDMMRSHDYTHLYSGTKPYLDKPPLVFWLSALSFQLFGVSTWAYKLPSVIFSLLAAWGTARLGSLLYNRRVGQFAGLIVASTQAFFLMNNDVKTDMYLLAPMILGLWQLLEWMRGGRFWQLMAGAALLGVGLLAKGPIAVVAAALAIGADTLLRRDWKALFRWQWLLVLPISIVVTTPFLIGQYQQYGSDGIWFFLWTQSFGRVTGESEWANDASAFFFVHTFAWAFLPWTGILLRALVRTLVRITRSGVRIPKSSEGIAIGGFLLVFAALSLSRFKLPHYIFIVAPFAAILTAAEWIEMLEDQVQTGWRRFFLGFQGVVAALALLLTGGLLWLAFPDSNLPTQIGFSLAAVVVVVDWFRSRNDWVRIVWPTALVFGLCNLALNLGVYPRILHYQSTAQAGRDVTALDPQMQVYAYIVSGRALDFYSPFIAKPIAGITEFVPLLQAGPLYVYTDDDGKRQLNEFKIRHEVYRTYEHYPPNRLSLPFLNPATRPSVLKSRYLIHVPQQAVTL